MGQAPFLPAGLEIGQALFGDSMNRNVRLIVAYDGTEFAGWQRQADGRTVQALVEDTLAPIEKRPVTVIGAGRTDAGVHAAAQVANTELHTGIPVDELHRALNATLPEDVRVLAVDDMPPAFSARHDAKSKTYHYAIWNGVAAPPMFRRYVWHVPQPLDVTAMNAAAATFVGERDFAAFQATGSDVKTTVRRILASSVRWIDVTPLCTAARGDRFLRYEITGTGFLRHMVRNIVGTLTEIGLGRRSAADVQAILASRNRGQAGRTAPPQGLTLWHVEY